MTFLDAVQKATQALGEDQALAGLRDGAFDEFAAQGLPTRKHEEWKYTPVGFFETDLLADAELPLASPTKLGDVKSLVDAATLEGALRVVVAGGRVVEVPSSLPAGLRVSSLREGAGALAPGSVATPHHGAFVALNAALATDGVVIDVEPGHEITSRLQIIVVPTPDEKSLSCPRHVVHLGANAKLSVVETWLGGAKASVLNSVTEVQLEEGATLDLLTWSAGDVDDGQRLATLRVRQARSSTLRSASFWFGGRLNRHDLQVELKGEGAEAHLDGLFVGGGPMHVDNHTVIDHLVPHCTSRQLYKGILGGKSHGVFNGKVFFREGAVQSDTEQANHNLLLSDDAQIDTKPQLEIFNDDVKASHGSTVGQLDPGAIFYCQTRGISRRDAEHMLTEAFAMEMLESLPRDALRDKLEVALKSNLDALLESTMAHGAAGAT